MRDELDALCGAVRTLIELSGQILDGKYRAVAGVKLVADNIELRLGKDGAGRIVEQLCVDILGIVATDDAYVLERGYAEQSAQLGAEAARLVCKLRLLFLHILCKPSMLPPFYCRSVFAAASARCPISRRQKPFSKSTLSVSAYAASIAPARVSRTAVIPRTRPPALSRQSPSSFCARNI